MFGAYVSPELVEELIAGKEISADGARVREKLCVLVFFDPEWGFSDAALPKLRVLLQKMGGPPVELSHRGLTICFWGEDREDELRRIKALLELSATEPEFEGFRIGVAEGMFENAADRGRITRQAFKNVPRPRNSVSTATVTRRFDV